MSSAMVLLMVPGLALFYGGLVRRKNVLATMLYSFAAMGIIGVEWVVIGYALAFGRSLGGWIGWDPSLIGLIGLPYTRDFADKAIPELVFVMFQGKFAIITPALISGAVAERMKFSAFVWFVALWTTLVYYPLAHWVWASAAGCTGTACWISPAGRSSTFPRASRRWSSRCSSARGVTIAQGGRRSSPQPDADTAGRRTAVVRLVRLQRRQRSRRRASGGGPHRGPRFRDDADGRGRWGADLALIEWWHQRRPTSLGLVSGILAGLVAITPAAGHVIPAAALAFGALGAAACYGAVQMKQRFTYDDSLDAFGVHGVGGLVGALLTGVFCFMPVAGLQTAAAAPNSSSRRQGPRSRSSSRRPARS